jgi:hypothetical protein
LNSKFKVIENFGDSKGHPKEYFYTTITDRKKLELKQRLDKNEIKLYCCCENNIQQKISASLVIYNAKHNEEHSSNCYKHKNYVGTSIYDQGWKEDADGHYIVRLTDLFPTNKPQAPIVSSTDSDESGTNSNEEDPRIYIPSSNQTQKGHVTIFGFATKLNMIAWERFAKEGIIPANPYDMGKKVYGLLRSIRLTSHRKPLQDRFYKKSFIRDMKPNKDIAFFYMLWQGTEEKNYKNGKTKHFLVVKDNFEKEHRFYVDKALYEDKWNSLGSIRSDQYIAAGFAYKATSDATILTVSDFAIFPISNEGLYVESSFERTAYEFLCQRKRLFFKPYSNLAEYGNKRPDLILIDREKPIIGEVFGRNTEDYLREREVKLHLAEQLKDDYDFWKWDAYLNEEIQEPF